MINTGKFAGKTVIISGGSRGIGKAIALKLAADGANVSILAKTTTPHPKLPGTIYTAVEEIEKAGGKGLPCVCDIRSEESVQKAVEDTVRKFGGIDICINNASAISLTGTLDTPMKRYDLMNQVNARGTYMLSRECIPYLKQAKNPHILNMSPPLIMDKVWFSNHVAYTIAKYGMSMCVLGMHEEFRPDGIAVNALWPRTAIWTSAMQMLSAGSDASGNRKVDIVSDAAYALLSRNSKEFTGNFVIDEEILKQEGVTDFEKYACVPGAPLTPDFFIAGEEESYKDESRRRAKKQRSPGSLQQGISKLQKLVNQETVKNTNAVFEFHIKNAGVTEIIYLDLKNGSGAVGQGQAPQKADIKFEADADVLLELLDGSLSPSKAFTTQKLAIRGNVTTALKLESLLRSLK
ncbi:unnamed protein product [Bursaphelenchus xylophilus]|uniref:Hydroxysteroid dehydrogenase-like protein 2 n=1 Tax=Bursaphelenchus xylophilus TaxID=6326 RepID=A0A1I7RPV5_BURXY|nr:unnamed protein product [Bursaphelenchus xylophilus]CAG9096684.1 unnamed protein product [Bursaphelenchus xylophilus]